MGYAILGACLIAAWGVTIVALKNWKGDRYLCDDCIFNRDSDCVKEERPRAIKCTAYRTETIRDYRM